MPIYLDSSFAVESQRRSRYTLALAPAAWRLFMCYCVQRGAGVSRRFLVCVLVREREDGTIQAAQWAAPASLGQRWASEDIAKRVADFVNALEPSLQATAVPEVLTEGQIDPWGIRAEDECRHA